MIINRFESERLFINEYNNSYIDDYVRIVRQPEVYATTYGIPRNYNSVRAKLWFKAIKENMKKNTAYEFAIVLKETNRYIGNIGLININAASRKAEITYIVDRDYMNRGIATEAAAIMLDYGFNKMELNKISGICMSVNPASRRVMEKLGMKYEGTVREDMLKDRVYYDIDILSILRSEYTGVPPVSIRGGVPPRSSSVTLHPKRAL